MDARLSHPESESERGAVPVASQWLGGHSSTDSLQAYLTEYSEGSLYRRSDKSQSQPQ